MATLTVPPSSATWITAITPNQHPLPPSPYSQPLPPLLKILTLLCFTQSKSQGHCMALQDQILGYPWDLIPCFLSLSLAHCVLQLPAAAHTQLCSYCSYLRKCSSPWYLLGKLPHFFPEFITILPS